MKKLLIFLLMFVLLAGCEKTVPTTGDLELSGLNNKKLAWGLKKNKNSLPNIDPGAGDLLSKYAGYYVCDTSQKELYLTFDEGYENGYTGAILDVLKKQNVPACFFVTGPYLKKETALIKRMVDEGHEVGNHTVNHPSMPKLTDIDELENEMLDLDRDFFELTGKTMKYMRPPMGEYSERTLAITKGLGYKTIFWSIAYMDWDINKQQGTDFVYQSVIDYLHNGAIILMHAVSKDNANALDSILTEAKNEGYTFKSLNDLK